MDIRDLIIDDDVLARMGPAGAQAAASLLHRQGGDCQTCVTALGGAPSSLCVDRVNTLATASLHHAACRASTWNDTRAVAVPAVNSVTYHLEYLLLALGDTVRLPLVLLNPSLEMVVLRESDGGWWPRAQTQYLRAGMAPVALDGPIPVARAISARADAGFIRIRVPSGDQYPTGHWPTPPQVLAEARAQRSMLLAVTHAGNGVVGQTTDTLSEVLRHPITVLARIPLDG